MELIWGKKKMLETPCCMCCQDANTGHNGSLSTCHANNAKDVITRLETLVLLDNSISLQAVRRQIGAAIDVIIHLGRMKDRTRKVVEITGVSCEDGNIILKSVFSRGEDGVLRRTADGLYALSYEHDGYC